jgi:polyisoprenoid-binding protein YceI
MKRPLRAVLVLVVAGLVLATAGTWLYLNVLREDAPERLRLDGAGTTATTTAPGTATGLDGTWTIGAGSQAGYRVDEVLFGQRATAVGRTEDVTGAMSLSGTTVTAASFRVDMATVASDEARRDGQFRGRIMEVDRYPTATFVLTEPIALGTLPADGAHLTTTATGKLTLHGATRTVTFDLQAKRTGATIAVAGTIPVVFADYGIGNPSGGPAQTEDEGEVEFLLTLTR